MPAQSSAIPATLEDAMRPLMLYLENRSATAPLSREESMIKNHGECVSRAKAAKLVGKSAGTVAQMLDDGRLQTACGGEKVCVRSIARYIDTPRLCDFKARHTRKGQPTPRFFIPPPERKEAAP